MTFTKQDISAMLDELAAPEQVVGHSSPYFPHWLTYQPHGYQCVVEDGYYFRSCVVTPPPYHEDD